MSSVYCLNSQIHTDLVIWIQMLNHLSNPIITIKMHIQIIISINHNFLQPFEVRLTVNLRIMNETIFPSLRLTRLKSKKSYSLLRKIHTTNIYMRSKIWHHSLPVNQHARGKAQNLGLQLIICSLICCEIFYKYGTSSKRYNVKI